MSADHPTPPLKHVLTTAREYLTHWFSAGVILTLTGFTPDHWVERLFHALKLDDLRDSLPAVDYRLLAVGIGVAVSTCALIFQSRRGRQKPLAAALASTPAPAAGAAPVIDDLDDIAHKPSIAVLPFVNLSSDPEQEFFADGMTEDIITGLSFDSRLFVTARNSTFAYKGQSPDIRTVGKELGVRYVLEGSIRPIGEQLRISVQLIETASGNHVWADRIDRPKAELFDVMDEVVDGIVITLCANLGVAEHNRAMRQRPEDLQAWALCAQADFLIFGQPSPETIREATRLAQRATEIEPGYAAAWAVLGYVASVQLAFGLSANLKKDSEAVLALISKALSLAPNDPMVLGYCGYAAIWAGEAALAVDYLARSLAINPNNNFASFAYGEALNVDTRPVEGAAQLQLFIRRSPKDPFIGMAFFFLAFSYLALDEFHQAEQAALNCVKHLPGFGWAYLGLASCLAALGRNAEIAAPMQKVRQLAPNLNGQAVEDFWRHTIRNPELAEKFVALTRRAFGD